LEELRRTGYKPKEQQAKGPRDRWDKAFSKGEEVDTWKVA
jgi:hypothetical protein